MSKNLYELNNISKTYNYQEGPVLEIERLIIPRNQVVVILGYSGSGKTTLLNILGMLDHPDTTKHTKITKELKALDSKINLLDKKSRRNIQNNGHFGFVFQEGYLLSNLTNRLNIESPIYINGLKNNSDYIDELLTKFHLDKEKAERNPSMLSGGQAQRIAVIRSIVHNPNIIFADEPTSSLHHDIGMEIMKMLRDWCKESNKDNSLIWVTHNIDQAADLADHIIFLRDGKVIKSIPNPKNVETIQKVLKENIEPKQKHDKLGEPGLHLYQSLTKDNSKNKNLKEFYQKMMKFILIFAISDIFPKTNRKFIFLPKIMMRKNSQFLNMLTLFMVLLFGLFFLNISFSLKNYFVTSVSDPRINKIVINSKKNGLSLEHNDMERLSSLVWVKNQGKFEIFITWKKNAEKKGYQIIRNATLGAFGSRDRGFDCYLSKKAREDNFSSTYTLNVVSLNVMDPILEKYYLLEGNSIKDLRLGHRKIQDIYKKNGKYDPKKRGIIITKDALEKGLGYSTVPKNIDVDFMSKHENLPLLGVVKSLPFLGDMMVTEGWFETHYYDLGSNEDPLPGYERISVYIQDMLNDGLPMCDAIIDLKYITGEDVKARLEWIKNLTDFVMLFSIIAAFGVLIIACGALFSSYAQAVKQKQKEIGVLMAFGMDRFFLYAIFFIELMISIFIAIIFVFAGHILLAYFLKIYMFHKLSLDESWGHIFQMPIYIWPSVISATVITAAIAVYTGVRKIIKSKPAEILKNIN